MYRPVYPRILRFLPKKEAWIRISGVQRTDSARRCRLGPTPPFSSPPHHKQETSSENAPAEESPAVPPPPAPAAPAPAPQAAEAPVPVEAPSPGADEAAKKLAQIDLQVDLAEEAKRQAEAEKLLAEIEAKVRRGDLPSSFLPSSSLLFRVAFPLLAAGPERSRQHRLHRPRGCRQVHAVRPHPLPDRGRRRSHDREV